MDTALTKIYGNKVRVRICGLCWDQENLLMVNHRGLNDGDFWGPPGGGLDFGESVDQCLKKEFLEETGLRIITGRFLFGCEFLKDPLHAIELFFEVSITGGHLQKGDDPELSIINAVQFMSPADIAKIPNGSLHGIFHIVPTPLHLKTLSGFFSI